MDPLQKSIQEQLEVQSTFPPSLQYAFTQGRHDIELFAKVFLGMPLHPGQRKFYRKGRKKINLLVPANRWGKTATISIKHIHKCFYKIGIGTGDMKGWAGVDYRTANVAPESSMTEPCFIYIKQILQGRFPVPQADGSVKPNDCLIKWFLDNKRIINTAPYFLYYVNNSRTEFKSMGADKGDALQSKPYGYISYDEGGRSNHLETELWGNLLSRLADWNGELDLPCTPDTNSHSILYHYELFERGISGIDPLVYAQEGELDDNIFLSEENRTAQKRMYAGSVLEPQVIYGKFVFSGANIFPAGDILAAKTEQITYGNKSVMEGMPYVSGHQYVVGIDTAIGSDERVYTVIDTTDDDNFKTVNKAWCKGNEMSPQLHQMDLLTLWDMYNKKDNVRISLETWNGESARFYMDMPRELQRKTTCFGSWQPPAKNGNKKRRLENQANLIVALRKKLAAHELQFASTDNVLTKQLNIYKEDDSKLPTDHVFSLALAVFLATDGKRKTSKLELVTVNW